MINIICRSYKKEKDSYYLCIDLKYTFVIILITALMAQTFSRSIAMADYMVNLETYKKNCVNKAKPMLNCNGKCQMLKKIKKQQGDSGTGAPAQGPGARDSHRAGRARGQPRGRSTRNLPPGRPCGHRLGRCEFCAPVPGLARWPATLDESHCGRAAAA